MACFSGAKTVNNALLVHYDVLNKKSYAGSGTNWGALNKAGNSGTLTNTPIHTGNSFTFDGSDDYVSISSPARLLSWAPVGSTGNKIISIETWVKTTDTTGQIVSKPWNGNGVYNYRLTHNGFLTMLGGTHNLAFTSIADGTWKHLVAVANSTQKAVYVNGTLFAGFVDHGEISDTPFTGEVALPLALMTLYPYGQAAPQWPQTTHAIAGSMSTFKLYSKQLTAIEINQNFEATRRRYGV